VLRDSVNAALKEAMKAGDRRRISTLRLIAAAFQSADLEARKAEVDARGDNIEAGGRSTAAASEEALLGVLQKMIKQREEAAALYEKGGRAELAAQEREEAAIVASFLPKQLSDDEAASAIATVVRELNAQSMKDMGRVMAALKQRFAGSMDFAKASAKVKELLTSSQG
jgi:uncharacterized protein YqeY